ncbi:hypothetical protein [Paracoccus pacificus]|uniref:3-oxoacyl-[acyl-carrier-protein] synthase-1 n=1 Tax=Paracoccus pacificus TaxID=1463598 RepID=A0ABW4R5S2_9RHOB
MSGIAIQAAGVNCPAGDNLQSVAAALRMGERFIAQDRGMIGVDGFPVVMGAVMPPEKMRDYHHRIYMLFETAFVDCMAQLAARDIRMRAPLVLQLPEMVGGSESEAWFRREIEDRLAPRVSEVRFVYGEAAEALALLQARAPDTLHYVAAVDSLIDARLIDWMIVQQRLFSSTNPWGTIPGEGAAVLAVGPGGDPMAWLPGITRQTETEKPEDTDRGILGRALAAVMRDALDGQPAPARLLVDLNGSRDGTEEFGLAVASAGPAVAGLADRVETLMEQIGYPGAATGLILAALACQGERPALVAARSASGLRVGALFRATEDPA